MLDLVLAHSTLYPIYELLEYITGLVLRNSNCRISMTQGNTRIPQRSFREGQVMMVCQSS